MGTLCKLANSLRSLVKPAGHVGEQIGGLAGCRAIVELGGGVIAQDEFSSVVWGMPGEVVRAGLADAVLPLSQVGVEVGLRLKRRGG